MSKADFEIEADRSEKVERTNRNDPTVELHAWGLDNPSHMEWTNDGRLLVSERTAGRVADVTDGGNMDEQEPFAYNIKGPASMVIMPPEDGRILAGEEITGEIKDISDGGDVSDVEPFADGLEGPYSLLRVAGDDGDRIYARVDTGHQLVGIRDITEGGTGEENPLVVDEIPVKPQFPGISRYRTMYDEGEGHEAGNTADCGNWAIAVGEKLAYTCGPLGQMVIADVDGDVTTHTEHVKEGHAFAWGLDRLGGSKYNAQDGLVYATEPHRGSVIALDPESPQSYEFTPRLVEGLETPTCVRFSPDNSEMYVCGRGEGVIWKITDFRP